MKYLYLPFAWLFVGLFFLVGCGASTKDLPNMTPAEQFEVQDPACIAANYPVKADIDSCRARAKARLDSTLDAGSEGGK